MNMSASILARANEISELSGVKLSVPALVMLGLSYADVLAISGKPKERLAPSFHYSGFTRFFPIKVRKHTSLLSSSQNRLKQLKRMHHIWSKLRRDYRLCNKVLPPVRYMRQSKHPEYVLTRCLPDDPTSPHIYSRVMLLLL
jgi:hypothetical protein